MSRRTSPDAVTVKVWPHGVFVNGALVDFTITRRRHGARLNISGLLSKQGIARATVAACRRYLGARPALVPMQAVPLVGKIDAN